MHFKNSVKSTSEREHKTYRVHRWTSESPGT